MRPTPLAIFTLFCIGLQAIVGLCLDLYNGLREIRWTVLVGFIVAVPIVSLAPCLARLTGQALVQRQRGPRRGPGWSRRLFLPVLRLRSQSWSTGAKSVRAALPQIGPRFCGQHADRMT